MTDEYQLSFNFDEQASINDAKIKAYKKRTASKKQKVPETINKLGVKEIRRAILAWIIKQNPTGSGILVPTRISRFMADVAAFWSKGIKRNGEKQLLPIKTVIIEARHDREQCWPDCAKKEELLGLLKEEKKNRKKLQKIIRKNEPHLRLDDNLFSEFENWDYSGTSNKNYLKCIKKIEEIERSLYNGSRFEKIRRSRLADYLYLAVPEGEVEPNELADGWGLLYVNKNLKVRLIKEASNWNCSVDKKLHLVQNIAASNMNHLLFSNGIKLNKNNDISFIKKPRRRRK